MEDNAGLLELLDGFHITDRALLRAREAAQHGGQDAGAGLRRAAERYFRALERESLRLAAGIDKKLDDLYQRQYNLQCERGIVERRLQAARKVLAVLGAAAVKQAAESRCDGN
jgi:hypothetical protein